MRSTTRLMALMSLAPLFLFCSCQNPVANDFGYYRYIGTDLVEGAGTITYLGFEGGFYGIATGKEGSWDPINLPSEFMKDGLRVKFRAKLRKDLGSFHMWGVLIELISIEKT